MTREVISLLAPGPGRTIVDCTVGEGGHALEILKWLDPGGVLVGIDQDPDALRIAGESLKEFGASARLGKGNFRFLGELLAREGFFEVDGVLMDLGMRLGQIVDPARGFSFLLPGPLDMRMDPSDPVTAASVINRAHKQKLLSILKELGEEPFASAIAESIVLERRKGKIETTSRLASIVSRAIPRKKWPRKIHPATRTFQALRIFVNDELQALKEGLRQGIQLLKKGGRICVLSYHSLEDRIVKWSFKAAEKENLLKILTKKPLTPGREEMRENPMSRSAKLRGAEKIASSTAQERG